MPALILGLPIPQQQRGVTGEGVQVSLLRGRLMAPNNSEGAPPHGNLQANSLF